MTMDMVAMERKGQPHVQRVALPPCVKPAKRESPRRLTAKVCVCFIFLCFFWPSAMA